MAREIRLVRRPRGVPTPDDFALVETALSDVAAGELAIQNLVISVDPYVRLTLDRDDMVGRVVMGSGLGRVVQSRDPRFREGDLVRHFGGMRERLVCEAKGLTPVTLDPELPLAAQLHALGGIGLCAYGGLFGTGRLQEGEQVFVSAAAGAVGSLAVQIAKIWNCTVIGSTGSEEKATWLRDELKLDAVINYKKEDIGRALAAATPKGIDVYFDNVGGAHLEAALARMNHGGRIPVCGMISIYNGAGKPVMLTEAIIFKRVLIQGFGFTDFPHLEASFRTDMTRWLKEERIVFRETVLDGFERVPDALIGLFSGLNTGKMLVRVAD